MEFEWELE
jgi:hypothetical protein